MDSTIDSPFDDSFAFEDAHSDLGIPTMGRTASFGKQRHFSSYSTYSDDQDANSIGKTPIIQKKAHFNELKEPNRAHHPSFIEDGETEKDKDKNNLELFTDEPKRSESKMERTRWGTQRHKDGKVRNTGTLTRGVSILGRSKTMKKLQKDIQHAFHKDDDDDEFLDNGFNKDEKDKSHKTRKIYWNLPLQSQDLDEEGNPPQYARNKIRTTKYTPVSFIPKNLYFQFGNVANIYFLTVNILGAFSIFGVPNPALSAVPLIVIVVITAFKDALEDSRRTILDLEVNNQVTRVLKGVDNPNFNGENISLWRKFKKANTKFFMALLKKIRNEKTIDPLAENFQPGMPRTSLDSFDYRRSMQLERMANAEILGENSDPFADPVIKGNNDEFQTDIDKHDMKLPSFVSKIYNSSSIYHPTFKKEYWKNVHVGDIIKVKNNDPIPVDVVILSTSDEDGACYVETKNLDGETNLKVKQAMKCSHSELKSVDDFSKCKFWLESEGPKSNLYSYEGNLKYFEEGNENSQMGYEPVNINNMLLRGCSLRNTKWVVGLVVFTGDDTKIMLNSGITPTKKSRISRELNWSVILNFLLLFILCLVSAIANGIYYNWKNVSKSYFEYGNVAGSSPVVNGIVSFVVAVILYQSLVPISLYISIEIVKTAQAYFIYSDVQMYYEKLDYPCVPKSWNISDDVGQIEYIFSDKTGTLTQNVMEFKKATINGVQYGRAYTEAYAEIRRRQGINVEEESVAEKKAIALDKIDMLDIINKLCNGTKSEDVKDLITFISKKFALDLDGKSGQIQKQANENFMLALALCHSVLTEKSEDDPNKIELRAQSPDEAALVATARDVGFSFVNRTKKGLILNIQGEEKEYQILNILEFNSTRKRMSAIVKIPSSTPGGEPSALLICKGADSVIYSRLSDNNDKSLLEKTAVHLEQFATEGLRTLCIAQRQLSWNEYLNWQENHKAASASLKNREDKMEEVASSIERNLILLGGTAIEDRLQDGVPECIQLLAKAGIKLWVLTGDKVETAINIGFSCNLLENSMQLLVIKTSGDDLEHEIPQNILDDKLAIVEFLIEKYLDEHFDMTGSLEDLENAKKIHEPPSGNFAVIIDGDALKLALGDALKIKFLLLCKQCKAVLCCRVSPAQKASVVKLVKETLDVMTLAIGDGSNDVAMIQAADVGVGIAGEEGTQAVMSSDYAVGQFRYLSRLVLIHGRWSYKRLGEMIPSFFYKNAIFSLALFWYGIYCNFDGTYLFEFTYLTLYNLAFTSLPVIFLGIFDQDVDDNISLLVPQLYKTGILRTEWNFMKFYWYMVDGFYQSIISFFYPWFLYSRNSIINKDALPLDQRFYMGALVACISIISCNLYVLMRQYRWDWLTALVNFISNFIVFAWTGIWSSFLNSDEFYKVGARLYGAPSFWACFFVGVLMCLLPRFSYDFACSVLYPKDIEIIRECVQRGDFKHYPRNYDPTDPNRAIISKYAQQHTLETQLSPTDFPEPQPTYRDSLNGDGSQRGSMLKRLFHRQQQSFSPSIPMNPSLETLRTEEIELEFSPNHKNVNGAVATPSLSVKNKFDSKLGKRTSLDYTRQQIDLNSLNDVESRPTGNSLEKVRSSLEIPNSTNADALMGRFSKEYQR
ncbi:aminophospholipid-translocating P4-type ATPase [Martiniozyma asiatica (nom. inval.)]|nr:aminophospholipid-translocating P4-type ATPase [Martiniozyma asiatica]